MSDICENCGLPESDHCVFVPAIMPDGCQCDPCDWDDVPPICDDFTSADYDGERCATCEHDRVCHEAVEGE